MAVVQAAPDAASAASRRPNRPGRVKLLCSGPAFAGTSEGEMCKRRAGAPGRAGASEWDRIPLPWPTPDGDDRKNSLRELSREEWRMGWATQHIAKLQR